MKKFIVALITLVVIVSSTTVAFAWDHPSNANGVKLIESDRVAHSSTKSDPFMYFEGKNTSPKQRVYFQMQYSFDKKKWKDDVYLLATPNTIVGKSESNRFETRPYWRLELNPYGPSIKGATAYGWMW